MCYSRIRLQAVSYPLALALCALAVIAAFALAVPSAFAAGLMGTVSDSSGPLSGIAVTAWRFDTETGNTVPEATVSAVNGSWAISGLPEGDYVIEFRDATFAHALEFYNDIHTASPTDTRNQHFSLSASETQSGIGAVLESGGSVSGRVTSEVGGAALAGANVECFVLSSEMGGTWVEYNDATSDSSGDFLLRGVPEGNVRVRFSKAGFVTEMYDNVKVPLENEPGCATVPVTNGHATTGVDAQLAAVLPAGTGAIAGTVTAPGGDGLAGVRVEAFVQDASGWSGATSVTTNGGGAYTLANLSQGTYRLRFVGPGGAYLTECWDDVAGTDYTLPECTSIVVGEGANVTGKDVELAPAAMISGTVRDSVSGDGLADITVTVWRHDGGTDTWVEVGSAMSGSDGAYTVGKLTTGTYRLAFSDETDTYADKFYDTSEATSVDDPSVTSISATAGSVAAGHDVELERIVGPVISPDAYEPDDSYLAARSMAPGETQSRTIDEIADYDWVKITGRAGCSYRIITGGAEPLDATVKVFGGNGITLLAAAEGYHAAAVHAPVSDGVFYARVGAFGPGPYTLAVEETVTDHSAPVTTSNAKATYTATASIALSVVDEGSGVATTLYSLDGGPWISGTSVTVTKVGAHTLAFYSVDKLGNREAQKTVAFTVVAAPLPKVTLGAPVAPKTMKRSKSYTVYGSLKPRHTSGTKPVRIYKYRKVSGKWKSYGYVTAKASNYSTYSRYKASVKLTTKGSWRLRAYAPADTKHAATWSSKYDYVTVK